MKEVWAKIPGWEALYEVSSLGRVRSRTREVNARGGGRAVRQGRMLRPVQKQGRYWAVTLADGDSRKQYLVHNLVTQAFLGPKPANSVVRHLNDNRDDNCLRNLCYGTSQENEADAARNGRKVKGVSHGMAKLTEADVLWIRASKQSNKELAEVYGVAPSHIWGIRARRTWKHI